LVKVVEGALPTSGGNWAEANHLLLRRGPYVIAAGLDETVAGDPLVLPGRFVNLFDPELNLNTQVAISPGSRYFLLDLNRANGSEPKVLASACKALVKERTAAGLLLTVEGVEGTPGIVLAYAPAGAPRTVTLDGKTLETTEYSAADHLLWIRFANQSLPRELKLVF
jgi:hypothetical protein